MQKTKYFKGFTLVELIIVITILAILGSIAFVSFGVYSKNSRDSSRLSTMSTIQKGISLNQVTTDKAILPDDYTQVFASGNLMGYEGIVGENVGRIIGLNSIPEDPKTKENYIYYTNKDRNKVQIMGFLEGEEMTYLGVSKAQAAGSGTKIPKVVGDNLGIILDSNYNRVTGEEIDILLGNSSDIYNVYFSNTDSVTSTGGELFSNIYNRRTDLLNDKSLASFDDTLVGYWDMETLTGGMLKDLSKYGNDGTCYNSGTIVNCGGDLGPKFISGIIGKSMIFDGIDDRIFIGTASEMNLNLGSQPKTLSAWFYKATTSTGNSHKNIVGLTYNGAYGTAFALEHNFDKLFFYGHGSAGYDFFGDSLIDNKLYFATITYDGTNIKIYTDGKLVSSGVINNNITNGEGHFYIGSLSTNPSLQFGGLIDDVRVYNRALSSSEIKELYNSIN